MDTTATTPSAKAQKRYRQEVAARLDRIERFLGSDRPTGAPPTRENLGLADVIRLVVREEAHASKHMRDAGVWRPEQIYAPGATTTHKGAGWVCQKLHSGRRPGEEGSAEYWRLSVKSDTSELRKIVREEIARALNGKEHSP